MTWIALLALAAQETLEPIDPEFGRAIAEIVVEKASDLESPRLKIEADPAGATGLHVPDTYGLMIVPQKDLDEKDTEGYAAETGKPLGYLFLYRMIPKAGGEEIDAKKLHEISITNDDGETRTVHALHLSVRRVADDDWRLYAFGTEEKPVLDLKFRQGVGTGTKPVALLAPGPDRVEISVFDKYLADFAYSAKTE